MARTTLGRSRLKFSLSVGHTACPHHRIDVSKSGIVDNIQVPYEAITLKLAEFDEDDSIGELWTRPKVFSVSLFLEQLGKMKWTKGSDICRNH